MSLLVLGCFRLAPSRKQVAGPSPQVSKGLRPSVKATPVDEANGVREERFFFEGGKWVWW